VAALRRPWAERPVFRRRTTQVHESGCEKPPAASAFGVVGDSARGRRWTLVAVCATTFMLLVDITIVNVALPSIQRGFAASLSGLQWVVDAYALTLAALILTAGALADRYGRRLVFAGGIAIFSVASLLCGISWNVASLDAARALQGVGGAALFATALALIGAEYAGPGLPGAIAAWGATVGLAVAAGPLLGGIITDAIGWRWIFFVNVPVGACALAIAVTRVRESRDPNARRADVAGLVTLAASISLIVFALLRGNASGWSSATILGSLVAGGVLLVAFAVVEIRQERPMLDVSLFRVPAFLGVQLATFCLGAGMFALFPFLSIYLQDIDGESPLGAGLRFLPITAFVFVVPLLLRRFAPGAPMRAMLAGSLAVIAGGLLLLQIVDVGSSWTVLLPGFIVCGIGIGIANPTIAGAALAVVDRSRTGMASGISNTCRVGGLALGVAALGAALQQRVGDRLAGAGFGGKHLAAAVSSAGTRAAAGRPQLAVAANGAFVSGLHLVLLLSLATVFVGSAAAALLVRRRPEPARAPVAATD
jgi:EmrB/QacA subfamily drug resistance transporter